MIRTYCGVFWPPGKSVEQRCGRGVAEWQERGRKQACLCCPPMDRDLLFLQLVFEHLHLLAHGIFLRDIPVNNLDRVQHRGVVPIIEVADVR